MLDHELNAFGMRMGLPGLAFSPQGLVALDVSGMGRLYFEKQQRHGQEELLVYLARPFPPHDSTLPDRPRAPKGPSPGSKTAIRRLYPSRPR